MVVRLNYEKILRKKKSFIRLAQTRKDRQNLDDWVDGMNRCDKWICGFRSCSSSPTVTDQSSRQSYLVWAKREGFKLKPHQIWMVMIALAAVVDCGILADLASFGYWLKLVVVRSTTSNYLFFTIKMIRLSHTFFCMKIWKKKYLQI